MLDLLKERVKDVDGMVDQLIWFHSRFVDEIAKIDGAKWYTSANTVAQLLADKYWYTLAQCAGVLSALSPAVLWETNILDAETIIKAHTEGKDPDSVNVSTYGQNKLKAYSILDSTGNVLDVAEYFTEETKTHAFYWNILTHTATTYVTVDRHAIGAVLASFGGDHMDLSVTKKRYRDMSAAYVAASKVLGYSAPCMFQAVIWVAYRDNFGGRPTVTESIEAPF